MKGSTRSYRVAVEYNLPDDPAKFPNRVLAFDVHECNNSAAATWAASAAWAELGDDQPCPFNEVHRVRAYVIESPNDDTEQESPNADTPEAAEA